MTLAESPGITTDDHGSALDAIELALGSDAVERSPDAIAEFRDPYRLAGTIHSDPCGVVFPTTTAEVQLILRTATRFGVPVWTSSQGRNYGYGGSEPRMSGSIVLNLRRMNTIHEINDESGYVELEPGVSFFELYEALRAGGHRYWMSTPDLGWGSVVGNALEHGLGYTPMGDHPGAICGMEVVLADGRVVRTGMGGTAGSKNWHVTKRGYGPSVDGLFSQSNMGVVTRVGMWLYPEPETYVAGGVMVEREEDLEILVDTLRPLMMDGTIQGYPLIVHAFGPISMMVPKDQWPPMAGSGTAAELAPVIEAMGIGTWIMRMGLYGHSDVVALNQARVEKAFSAIPGAKVFFTRYQAPYDSDSVGLQDQVPAGIPNMAVLDSLNAWGGREHGGHLDFSPVSPMTGRDAMAVFRTLWSSFDKHGVAGIYSLICRDRSLVHVNMLMYDTRDAAAIDAAYAACHELVDTIDAIGYGEYRSHQDLADDVAQKYEFGDHALHSMLGDIKDALDPAGILSPGKQGVWPSRHTSRTNEGGRS